LTIEEKSHVTKMGQSADHDEGSLTDTKVTVHVELKLKPMRMSVYVDSLSRANQNREFRRMGS
jgi:hypothetical protein